MKKCKKCNTNIATKFQFCEKCRIERKNSRQRAYNKKNIEKCKIDNRKKLVEYNKKYRHKKKKKGLCPICGKAKVQGMEKCQYHLDLAKKNAKNWYEKNKERLKKIRDSQKQSLLHPPPKKGDL